MKRAYEVFWITSYLDDVRADFFAIYHIMDWEALDGPLFFALAERLPLYAGALQARIKLESEDSSQNASETTDYRPGQTMTMAEALSGDAQLMAMQNESLRSGGGSLFEFQTG